MNPFDGSSAPAEINHTACYSETSADASNNLRDEASRLFIEKGKSASAVGSDAPEQAQNTVRGRWEQLNPDRHLTEAEYKKRSLPNWPTVTASPDVQFPVIQLSEDAPPEVTLPPWSDYQKYYDAVRTAEFANQIYEIPDAWNAVSKIETGPPHGERIFTEATPDERERLAIKGSWAYLQGEPGNSYTRFLEQRYGNNLHPHINRYARRLPN